MQLVELQRHLIMMNCLRRSSMTEEKKIPGVSEQATNLVDNINKWNNPHIKIAKPEVPDAPIPQVNTLNESELERKLDEKFNLPQRHIDTTVGRPTPQQEETARARMVERNKQSLAEAKEKYQEEQEAKHRKAEKMWSAIGDGISAIANMATVGAGADSMYNPADSLHSKVKSKWDEIKANKAAVAAVENKARMDLLLADLGYQHASEENEKNRQSKWNEFYSKLQETNRHNQEMEAIARDRAESYETNAQANKTRASKYKGGGSSSGGGGSSKHEFLGKSYPSANARNQAILDKANELGVPTHDAEKRPRRYADVEYDIRKKLATP